MRIIDRPRTRARAAIRRLAARLPRPLSGLVGPASVALQLSPTLPGEPVRPEAGAPNTAAMRRAVVDVVGAQGPVPVEVFTIGRALDAESLALVRFVHRLDCPVRVWTDGTGLDAATADALFLGGLDRIAILVAGLEDGVQEGVVGNAAESATDAVLTVLKVRQTRDTPVTVEVHVPWMMGVPEEARGVLGWARQAGVDRVAVLPPLHAAQVADTARLSELSRSGLEGVRTAVVRQIDALRQASDGRPGVPRKMAPRGAGWRPCPVGTARLSVGPLGRLTACPFHPPGPVLGPDDAVLQVWREQLDDHRSAVHACTRRCRTPALDLGTPRP